MKTTIPSSHVPRVYHKVQSRILSGGYSEFFRTRGMEDFWTEFTGFLLSKKGAPIKIVVPACSSGEEAYSIAMLVKRLGLRATITAFDRDTQRIRQAKEGKYQKSHYPNCTSRLLLSGYGHYFSGLEDAQKDGFSVTQGIKTLVTFLCADLLGDIADELLDADIICIHNVIARTQQEQNSILAACVRISKKGTKIFTNPKHAESTGFEAHQTTKIITKTTTDLILEVL